MLRCIWSSLMKRGGIVAEVCRRTSLTLFHWRQWARSKCEAVPFDLSALEKQLMQAIWAYLFLIHKFQCGGEKNPLLVIYTVIFLFILLGGFLWRTICFLLTFCVFFSLFLTHFSTTPPCFFLFELSALLLVGQATRCEQWNVWWAPTVLLWTILSVTLPPDPLTPR